MATRNRTISGQLEISEKHSRLTLLKPPPASERRCCWQQLTECRNASPKYLDGAEFAFPHSLEGELLPGDPFQAGVISGQLICERLADAVHLVVRSTFREH